MPARFVLKTAADGHFMFVLKAGNNEVILTSELYTQKHNAEKGIEAVRANAAYADRFEQRTSTDGRPYFVLKATNGEIVGTSQMYASAATVRRGIASVRRNSQFSAVGGRTAALAAYREIATTGLQVRFPPSDPSWRFSGAKQIHPSRLPPGATRVPTTNSRTSPSPRGLAPLCPGR